MIFSSTYTDGYLELAVDFSTYLGILTHRKPNVFFRFPAEFPIVRSQLDVLQAKHFIHLIIYQNNNKL